MGGPQGGRGHGTSDYVRVVDFNLYGTRTKFAHGIRIRFGAAIRRRAERSYGEGEIAPPDSVHDGYGHSEDSGSGKIRRPHHTTEAGASAIAEFSGRQRGER